MYGGFAPKDLTPFKRRLAAAGRFFDVPDSLFCHPGLDPAATHLETCFLVWLVPVGGGSPFFGIAVFEKIAKVNVWGGCKFLFFLGNL